jgi:NAD(P)-dependent dehydrogenase (short-subunit alcohol dehydrogenase family)
MSRERFAAAELAYVASMPRALVTGANRGIGREICRQLTIDHGFEVILCGRDEGAAREAAAAIGGTVVPEVLDVADDASVRALRGRVDALDVLVNNAGVVLDGYGTRLADADLDTIRRTLEINTFGALRMIQAFGDLVAASPHGRIVNVSSGMGGLTEMGAGAPGYRLSKAGMNALTRIASNELDGVLVNSACPGWVKTDLGGASATVEVEDGADTPVWLATLPDDGPTGGFFRRREPIAF